MIAMPDSVTVENLPPSYKAYLGYVDGLYPTAGKLAARFPAARLVLLTVTGNTLAADGADCERYDLDPAYAARWAARKLAADPRSRPVIYASLDTGGYRMLDVVAELSNAGVPRSRVRLLSAHWGAGEHVCGPGTCGRIGLDMDGTQWTDSFPWGNAGRTVDMSVLRDDFFNQSSNQTEAQVRELGIVRQGDSGEAVKTVQGLCAARGFALVIDGIYGPHTEVAVKRAQQMARISNDGVVGPQTWPVLLGIA